MTLIEVQALTPVPNRPPASSSYDSNKQILLLLTYIFLCEIGKCYVLIIHHNLVSYSLNSPIHQHAV